MTRPATIAILATAAAFASVSLRAQEAPVTPAAPAAAAPAGDELPDAPGRATVLRVCSSCHEPSVVATHRYSEQGWHDVVETMVGNGAQGTPAEFAEVTAYLAKNFPVGQ